MLELRIKKEELLKGVSQTQSIAEKRSSMPILSNILLEVQDSRLAITATDLEISFRGFYQAEVQNEGRLTVPARKFYEIVRGMVDEDLVLKETEQSGLSLVGARANYQLLGLPPDDFPPMPDYEQVEYMEISSEFLVDMIDKTIFSVSLEETRYNLAGVFLEKAEKENKSFLRMVSTDGHRLSLIEKEAPEAKALTMEKGVIISRKGLGEMRKMAENEESLKIGFSANSGVARGEDSILVMRLLEGRFPDYNLVIPKKIDKRMNLSRREFLEMLRRISVISPSVLFTLSPKELQLSAVNPDLGEAKETLPVEYEGEQLGMGFNPRYFIEAGSALKSEVMTIGFQAVGNPCVISAPEDPGFIGVIMPIKI